MSGSEYVIGVLLALLCGMVCGAAIEGTRDYNAYDAQYCAPKCEGGKSGAHVVDGKWYCVCERTTTGVTP